MRNDLIIKENLCFYDRILILKNLAHRINIENAEMFLNIELLENKDNINEFYKLANLLKESIEDLNKELKELIIIEKAHVNLTNKSLFKASDKMKYKPHYIN